MVSKKILIIVGIIIAVLVGSVAAQYVQSITNNHTGTVSNPQSTINIFYDGVNCTDGRQVDWGTLYIGENTMELNITNISEDPIRVKLFVSDIPTGVAVSWSGNDTLLDVVAKPLSSVAAPLIVTIDPIIPDGTPINWTQTATAEST